MDHTTTAQVFREALADEGVSVMEAAPYLKVVCERRTEILISASAVSGRSHFDMPVENACGVHADEFEPGSEDGTYVYMTGMQGAYGELVTESRMMAAAVNRTVTGGSTAVLLAVPLVRYLVGRGMDVVARDQRETVARLVADGETSEDETGCLLLRGNSSLSDLYALKSATDTVWDKWFREGIIPDHHLLAFGVRPYMVTTARNAVRSRWVTPCRTAVSA